VKTAIMPYGYGVLSIWSSHYFSGCFNSYTADRLHCLGKGEKRTDVSS
jgi:hypothetical protein